MKSLSSKVVASFSISVLLLGGCAHTEIVKTHYDNEFDPPRTWLSMRVGAMPNSEVSPRLVRDGEALLREMGDESVFEVAVRNESCRSICYFFMPRLSDHIYWVLTTDESQKRFNKYFSYSLPEHGNP
ncbi:hypothetical protein GCM10011521_16310 [Arenimonas soli]|uniref:Lipoprotein n=1 Tax=Arenimonas soli TaxID=2269504 RepID=A0ABQ1HJZ3_9GAMM|nr:hypothetical protein GCM10011521_16310 [Arenimonas soli]